MAQPCQAARRKVHLYPAAAIEIFHNLTLPKNHFAAFCGEVLLASGPWPPAYVHDNTTDVWVPDFVLKAAAKIVRHGGHIRAA